MNKTDKKHEALFTPWKIGNVEIKNRIVMCPMGGTSLFGWFELGGCDFDKEAAKLFLERANKNVGLIISGKALCLPQTIGSTTGGLVLYCACAMEKKSRLHALCQPH